MIFLSALQWFFLWECTQEQYGRQYSLYSPCGWGVLDHWLSKVTNLKIRRQDLYVCVLKSPFAQRIFPKIKGGLRENIKYLFTRTLALFLQGSPSLAWPLPFLQTFVMYRSLVNLVSSVSQAIKQLQSAVPWLFDDFLLFSLISLEWRLNIDPGFHIS